MVEGGGLAAHSQEHKELAEEWAVEWICGDGRLLVVAVLLALRSGGVSVGEFCETHDSLLV